MAAHVEKRAAKYTQKYQVTDVLSCRVCENTEDASALEVALTSLHMTKVGQNKCRGGRYNMCANLQRPPKYWERWEEIDEQVLREAKEIIETYEIPKNENGETPALCFSNSRDPTGQLRHLAALA